MNPRKLHIISPLRDYRRLITRVIRPDQLEAADPGADSLPTAPRTPDADLLNQGCRNVGNGLYAPPSRYSTWL